MTTVTRPNVSQWFATKERDDGTEYATVLDSAPQWLRDAARDAHDDEWPNDWRYSTLRAIAEIIDDSDEPDAWEIADQLVDIYNADLVQWIADDLNRSTYVDRWHDDIGSEYDDLYSAIRGGQYVAIEQMAAGLIAAIDANT